MKFITKIQSYTDVITNSSSTVFIMTEANAKFYEEDVPNDCCLTELIDKQWLMDHVWEWQLVFDFLDIDKTIISTLIENKWGSYWDNVSEEDWHAWLELNEETIKPILGLYWVDIEDHFEDAYDYTESARDDALFSDYRH